MIKMIVITWPKPYHPPREIFPYLAGLALMASF
jgi:hypothetical protein